jgi:hypothetical protein
METKVNQKRLHTETKTGKVWVSNKEMAPQEFPLPEARPTESRSTVDTTKSSAPAHPAERRLAKLQERYAHELLPEEERLELRERILKLRKKAAAAIGAGR